MFFLTLLALTLSSNSFEHEMDLKYGFKGQNISPEVSWSQTPAETKGFVLVLTDQSTPKPLVHWLVYNIPGDVHHIIPLPKNKCTNSNHLTCHL